LAAQLVGGVGHWAFSLLAGSYGRGSVVVRC
jgi:hypothetical protein